MRAVDRFTIAPDKRDNGRSLLARRGSKDNPISIDGLVVEAQFGLGNGCTLVCLTDDSPYEEGLHIYLLDSKGRVQDSVEAGAAWGSGILEIRQTSEIWIEFTFFQNGRVYLLQVDDVPTIRLSLPSGWRYKNFRHFRRHRLTVREGNVGGIT
jgi:hypothetical protein